MLRSLVGDSAQYLAGVIAVGLANTVLLPLYTRYLIPSDFGLYALIEVLLLGAIAIANLGFTVAYLKWYASSRPSEVAELLGTMVWVNGLAGALLGTVLWVFLASSRSQIVLHGDASQFAWLVLPLILLETLQGVFLTHLRAERRPAAFSIVSALRVVGIAAFSIWLIIGRGEGLRGVFQARMLGDLCGCLAMLGLSAKHLSLAASFRSALAMARYGLPVMASALIMMILDGAGRFFLNQYGNLEQVGRYAVAVKISAVMRMLVVVPFGAAWGGIMFQVAKRADAREVFSKIMSYLLVLSASLALIFSLFSPVFLLILATQQYSPSLPLIPWLLLVQAVGILQYPCSVGIFLGSATKWLLPVFSLGVALSLLLNRWWVPKFGSLGAVWAWLVTWVVVTVLLAAVGQRYYRLRYEAKPLLLALALASLVLLSPRFWALGKIVFPSLSAVIVMLLAIAYVWNDLRRSEVKMRMEIAD